jgi:predicted deacetylase
MGLKKIILLVILITILLLTALFLIRLFSQKQIDDVSPDIHCDKYYLEKSNILYIIPSFNNNNLSDNKNWCNEILIMNKTLALHGYHHNYNEFLEDKNNQYIQESINIFEKCFNQTPKEFKPPQLGISENNKELIKKHNLKLDVGFNQLFHKVYHCEDTGILSNKIIDWI